MKLKTRRSEGNHVSRAKIISRLTAAQTTIKDVYMQRYIQNWLLNANAKTIGECMQMDIEASRYIKAKL
jgi:hypothetical protein